MTKILIVDDNDNNRLTLSLLLEEVNDIVVSEAEDGTVALAKCEEESFDLIFMDIMMPKMDGFTATSAIKALQSKCMIIALSALDDEGSKQKMLSLGAEDYLTKPVNAELFYTRIHQYIRIIQMRHIKQESVLATRVTNPFSKNVYSRTLNFYVDKEEDLAEFWDYWLIGEKSIADLSDCVRLIYGFGLWLLKYNHPFSIAMEESESSCYMMLLHVTPLKNSIIRNVLLKHFPSAKYILTTDTLCFALDKIAVASKVTQSVTISNEAKKILTKTHIDVLSAVEYVENTAIAFLPKIDSLESINDETDRAILEFENAPSKRSLAIVYENFQEYADVLEQLVDFTHLGFALRTLIDFLSTLVEEQLEPVKVKKLSSMLLNLLHDLNSWRENVFITQVARDIHYLDASLLSSCIQIEAIFEEKSADVSGEDDEIEFF